MGVVGIARDGEAPCAGHRPARHTSRSAHDALNGAVKLQASGFGRSPLTTDSGGVERSTSKTAESDPSGPRGSPPCPPGEARPGV